MNWLKAFGLAVKAGATIVPVLGPIAAAIIPGSKDDVIIAKVQTSIEDLTGIVMNAEVFGAALNLQGADKLKGAVPAVAQIILKSSIMAGQAPANKAMFDEGVADLTTGLVKILNSKQN